MSRHISVEQRAALVAALNAQRQALGTQHAVHMAGKSRAEHAREVLQQDGDDATQRDADREVDLALADRDVVAMAAIDNALERLAAGTFGWCADCDEEIPLARLRLQPTARRCVACQSRRERAAPRTASM